MSSAVKPIPDGLPVIIPHLIIQGAEQAIEFYKQAFGAEEVCRMPSPTDGKLMHAEIQLGNSRVYLCDEYPEMGAVGPRSLGGSPVTIHLSVEDTDASFARAVEAGATARMPPETMFWGDRYAKVEDPFGHQWSLATKVEELTPEEIQARAASAFSASS
ncbi:VOC family protein [soil metagenome]